MAHPVPMLDVVLMWHTHMSASGPYASDCHELFGRVIEERPAPARRPSAAGGDGGGAAAAPASELEAGVSVATRDRAAPGAWRFHYLETKRVWTEEFREAFAPAGTAYVPMESPHPAEAAMGGLGVLGCFEEGGGGGGSWRAGAHALYLTWLRDPKLQQPLAEAKAAAAAAAAAAAYVPPPPPPPPPPSGGLFSCFCGGGGGVDEDAAYAPRPAAAAPAAHPSKPPGPPLNPGQLRHAVAGVHAFKGLPLTPGHPYWRMLAPEGPDEVAETGPEGQLLEVFAGSGAAAAAQAQALANELGDDVEVDVADPLEWHQR
jgi:hypothetical protein